MHTRFLYAAKPLIDGRGRTRNVFRYARSQIIYFPRTLSLEINARYDTKMKAQSMKEERGSRKQTFYPQSREQNFQAHGAEKIPGCLPCSSPYLNKATESTRRKRWHCVWFNIWRWDLYFWCQVWHKLLTDTLKSQQKIFKWSNC